MYRIAICDDDAVFSAGLRDQLADILRERHAANRIDLFPDPSALEKALEAGARYELLFLDVLFGTERGLAFARDLRRRDPDADIVFVTQAPQYAVESYEAYPLYFMVKPVSREKLAGVVDRFLGRRDKKTIFLQTANGRFQVPCSDVLFFEVYDHEVIAHLTDKSVIPFKGTLRQLENSLPGQLFVRCHRCFLVNLEHIRRLERGQIHFATGESAPVSKRLYAKVMSGLNDYAERNCILFRPSAP